MQLDSLFLPIREELAQVETDIHAACVTAIPTITQVVQYVMQNGGKRVRPALTILAARLSGYAGDHASKVGAAIEMVHTASLLHDDVVDSATTRRGKPSANTRWGNHISVLVGDFFWCKACQLIVTHGTHRILYAITEAIVGTTEGEVIELVKSNDLEITEADYLHIIHHKTALLLSVACRSGAMLGDVSEGIERALGEFGLALGMAFQLADDALDYDCDEARLGKTKGTDLREGRLTWPLIHTLRQCTDAEKAMVKEVLVAPNLHQEHFDSVLALLGRYNAIPETRRQALKYADQAKMALQHFKPSFERETLERLCDYVVARDE